MNNEATLPGGWSLDGRRALVTGSSRGIGHAIALGLASAGADLVVHYRTDRHAADQTAAAASALGRRVDVLQGDLAVSGAGRALAQQAVEGGRRIDLVVLNAAATTRRPFGEIDAGDVSANVQIGLASSIEILQVLLPTMAERGLGRVVAIGSIQQVRQNPAVHLYAAMKSATANLMENLARQYGPRGITFNTVAPGLIATDDTASQLANPETARALLDEIPMGSVGQPEDCVGAVVLLCSDAGRYITGVTLYVDGGMHLPGRPRFVASDGTIKPS